MFVSDDLVVAVGAFTVGNGSTGGDTTGAVRLTADAFVGAIVEVGGVVTVGGAVVFVGRVVLGSGVVIT